MEVQAPSILERVKEALTLDALERWISGHTAGAPVGNPGSTVSCPLARYLDDVVSGITFSVDYEKVCWIEQGAAVCPDCGEVHQSDTHRECVWTGELEYFPRLIDRYAGQSQVSREEALEVLGYVREGKLDWSPVTPGTGTPGV